jgi:hypothetical protein
MRQHRPDATCVSSRLLPPNLYERKHDRAIQLLAYCAKGFLKRMGVGAAAAEDSNLVAKRPVAEEGTQIADDGTIRESLVED